VAKALTKRSDVGQSLKNCASVVEKMSFAQRSTDHAEA